MGKRLLSTSVSGLQLWQWMISPHCERERLIRKVDKEDKLIWELEGELHRNPQSQNKKETYSSRMSQPCLIAYNTFNYIV